MNGKVAGRIGGVVLITLLLASCGSVQSGFGRVFAANQAADDGPDEFAIVPYKPLEQPPNFKDLPEPTPGAPNRVDLRPQHDAVAALGGRPERLDSPNILPGESTLIAAAARYGTAANIREVLAKEDALIRERNGPRLLERWFGTDTYFRTYEDQTLRARTANQWARQRGIRTPTVPPAER